MQSENLYALQVLSKIGKVLSEIVFVFCIVGAALCAVGGIGAALGAESFKIGGTTIRPLLEAGGSLSTETCCLAAIVGFILCAAEGVISKLANTYFKHELAAGTPFTFEGARELLRLGICTISISVGAAIVVAICESIAAVQLPNVGDLQMGDFTQVGLGVAFIIVSVVFRYGAELLAERQMPNRA